GASGGLQLSSGLLGELANGASRIVTADDERFRRPLCVPKRGPDAEANPGLGVEGDDARAGVVRPWLDLPALGLPEPRRFFLPLGPAQTKDAVRVALADDALLRIDGRRRDDQRGQQGGGGERRQRGR